VRIISASNADLACASKFRQDLYYRLNVLPLNLPALRERREDIPLLAKFLLERHCRKLGKAERRFSPAALDKLTAHDWPGNVRELENVIQRAIVLSGNKTIEEQALDLPIAPSASCGHSFKAQKARLVHDFESRYLQEMLAKCNGDISQAAKSAEKERRTFFELLRKHNLLSVAHLSVAPVGIGGARAAS
jgi:DNA-binding NtrC family response regulator